MSKTVKVVLISFFLLGNMAWGNPPGPAQSENAVDDGSTLRFVVVNPEIGSPETVLSSFKPLMKWMSDRVKHKIDLVILPDIEQTVTALKKGEVDLGYTGIIDYFSIEQQYPIKPMVTIVKNGASSYTACLVVHSNNKEMTIESLRGTPFGYTSFHKVTGGLFPQTLLFEKGLGSDLEKFFSEVKPYYSDITAIRDLLTGSIKSCSISHATLDILAINSPGLVRNLHVLASLDGLMFAPFFYRANLDRELKDTLIEEILKYVRTSEGQQLLMMFKVDGLTRVSEEDYQRDKNRARLLGYLKAK
ncbi:phosphate/phosphite/phosphonate ABC transporter substrate-binding protein [bacterium]|nr:phosphate/phosphite/phosphonate ABC transporter substrate-binding protein [bacterium]